MHSVNEIGGGFFEQIIEAHIGLQFLIFSMVGLIVFSIFRTIHVHRKYKGTADDLYLMIFRGRYFGSGKICKNPHYEANRVLLRNLGLIWVVVVFFILGISSW